MKHRGTQRIITERLVLRRFSIDDAEAMYQNWASDSEVTKYLTWPAHASIEVSRAVLEEWVSSYSKSNYYQWAIVLKEHGPDPIGSIGAVSMNDDIDIVQHTLRAEYSGNQYISPSEDVVILQEKPLPVNIETQDIYVAQNNICNLKVTITSDDNDFINEGKVVAYLGKDNKKAEGYVKNNIAHLQWKVIEIPRNTPYIHTLMYEDGKMYKNPKSPSRMKNSS